MKLLSQRNKEIQSRAEEIKNKMSMLVTVYPKFKKAIDALQDLLAKGKNDAGALLLIGPAGMGKTSFSYAVKRTMLSEIEFLEDADVNPVILVESPHSSSKNGLASEVLQQLNDKSHLAGTVSQKIHRIVNYVHLQGVKLIIIDEIHNFLPKNIDTATPKALVFIKELMNKTKVPFLFMGTERAKALIYNDKELSSRLFDTVEFENFSLDKDIDSTSRRIFIKILNAYAKLLSEAGSTLLFIENDGPDKAFKNNNLIDLIHLATAGNLRQIRNLFQRLVDIALDGTPINKAAFAMAWRNTMNKELRDNPFISKAKSSNKQKGEVS